MLPVADLPKGFTATPAEADDEADLAKSSNEKCARMLDDLEKDSSSIDNAPRNAEAEFAGGQIGPFVSHSVGIWESDADPKKGMNAFRELLATCKSWTQTDSDGVEAALKLQELPIADLGDEAVAARVIGDLVSEGVEIKATLDLVAVRAGNGVSTLVVTRIEAGGQPSNDLELEPLAEIAAERLQKIV